jgi:hypothetical protein
MPQEKTLVPVKYLLSPNCRNCLKKRHCFGAYYREEVLGDLEGTNHQNIRNFMKSGWDRNYGEALDQNNQEVTIILQYMRWTIKPKPSDDKSNIWLKP